MSDFFYFRDFSMLQSKTGQRINTDSCVFGSLIGSSLQAPRNIVDIGTGTGVLALMLAIRFPESRITAIEPEVGTAEIAAKNFESSTWDGRIKLITARAQDLPASLNHTYDFVVCNPPYFQNSSRSNDHIRDVARHNVDLSPSDLCEVVARLMTADASAWIMFPEFQADLWNEAAAAVGLYLTDVIQIKDDPDANLHLTIAGWAKEKPEAVRHDLLCYRVSHRGPQSERMRAFRNQWLPERFNAQFDRPH